MAHRNTLAGGVLLGLCACNGPVGPAGPRGPAGPAGSSGEGEGEEAPDGAEGGPCYGNGTCDAGLSCLSGLCVDAGGEGEGEPPCRTIEGRVTVENSAELEALRGVCVITVDLHIESPGITSIEPLVALERVGGSLILWRLPLLTEIAFPSLRSVGGDLDVRETGAVESLTFPALTDTDGSVYLDGWSSALVEVSFPRLQTCQSFSFSGAPMLASLSLPAVEQCHVSFSGIDSVVALDLPVFRFGSFSLSGFLALSEVAIPAWEGGGGLSLTNATLATFSAPALLDLEGQLWVQSMPNLVNLDLPVLASVRDDLFIYGNAALPTVGLPVLSDVGRLRISENASLTTINLPALTDVGANPEIAGNPSLMSCSGAPIADMD